MLAPGGSDATLGRFGYIGPLTQRDERHEFLPGIATPAAPAGASGRASPGPTMDEPWDCVIRVGGALAPHWTAYLGGLRIAPAAAGGGDGEVLTELRGALPDQAAVQEVLRTLHALGFPLRSLTCTPLWRPTGARGRPGG